MSVALAAATRATVMSRISRCVVRCACVMLPGLGVMAHAARAQSVRGRIDASAQAVAFRGLRADSVLRSDVVIGSDGATETLDGYAVRCGAGAYCFYFRPGPEKHALPLTTAASVVMWGLGVEGLSLHASARLIADAGRDDVWPTTSPFAQLLEGYAEYTRTFARGTLRARGGRQLVTSRLEPMGFDGAWANARLSNKPLEFTAYAGWGLAQAAVLSVASSALNPLDEWRPRQRQQVAGAEAAWANNNADVRAEYRREIDPEDHNFVSERAAVSGVLRIAGVRANGGFDYNLAEGRFGSADVTLTFARPEYSVSTTARRYRPYFSLWTLWGAFSPVGYNALNTSVRYTPNGRYSFRVRGERYWYDDAEVSTALVTTLQDRGWRASGGATATLSPRWTLDAALGADFGMGASSEYAELSADFAQSHALSFGAQLGIVDRPLELRFYDATSRWVGVHGAWQFTDQRRVWTDISFVGDERNRADAGASALNQVRVRAGISLSFGNAADRVPLPPARRPGS